MAIEPVNERPLLPQIFRGDPQGVQQWSNDLIRQLIQVFQQYGYRINRSPTLEGPNAFTNGQTFEEPIELTGETWGTPTLQNNWVAFGAGGSGDFGTLQYRKLPSGQVILRGIVRDGDDSSLIATLPVGYRPGINQLFILGGSGTGGSNFGYRVDVRSNGQVVLVGVAPTYLSMSGITFFAE